MSDNSQETKSEPVDSSMPCPSISPSSGGTTAARVLAEKCELLKGVFEATRGDKWIRKNLNLIRGSVVDYVEQAGVSKLQERLRNSTEFRFYVKPGSEEERKLVNLLKRMAKTEVPWAELFQVENEAFFKTEKNEEIDPAMTSATTNAWNSKFKGDLAHVLFDTISDYLSQERTPRARLSTVVNSSGTGKSRMVDQLGTVVVTVPMCLRRAKNGFPPPDEDLRNWLQNETYDREKVQTNVHGLTYALLTVTHKRLETITEILESAPEKLPHEKRDKLSLVTDRQKDLASAFRQRMTEGQTFYTSNPYRKKFYSDVIKEATEFVNECEKGSDKSKPKDGRYITALTGASGGKDLRDAGETLCHFIDEDKVLNSKNGPRRPLVILAFDEADTLTDNAPVEEGWNLLSELCHVLRRINHLQIFSLFLSTNVLLSFNNFLPGTHRLLNPISEVSFDDIAYPAMKDTVTIGRVSEIDWISHLGRPLFGSFWDNVEWYLKNEQVLVDYAKEKLLGDTHEQKDRDRTGTLACLSTRFALEFNMGETAHDVACRQVEWHMRLCITATTGLEKIVTISGSEPLLAEAAYELMKSTNKNAVHHLAMHPDLNCIDRGRRGELVAALLIMQSYDAARRVFSPERWVSVDDFMEALLPLQKYRTLLQSAPTSWPMDHGGEKTFQAIFKDYGMWFNHVIRIETKEMISIDHLWKFVVRGAMILCTTNQEGVDIVLPVCHMTEKLGPESVTAIVVQVKNGKEYKATLQGHLFDAMDTVVKSTIFCKLPEPGADCEPRTPAEPDKKRRKVEPREPVKVKPKAVIRVVMALASPEPAVVFKDRPEQEHCFDGFSTFDIWLAGLSNETFGQIQDGDLGHYKMLLERSLGASHDGFELKDVARIGEKAKESRGDRRRKVAPLAFPEPAHHRIHRVKGQGL